MLLCFLSSALALQVLVPSSSGIGSDKIAAIAFQLARAERPLEARAALSLGEDATWELRFVGRCIEKLEAWKDPSIIGFAPLSFDDGVVVFDGAGRLRLINTRQDDFGAWKKLFESRVQWVKCHPSQGIALVGVDSGLAVVNLGDLSLERQLPVVCEKEEVAFDVVRGGFFAVVGVELGKCIGKFDRHGRELGQFTRIGVPEGVRFVCHGERVIVQEGISFWLWDPASEELNVLADTVKLETIPGNSSRGVALTRDGYLKILDLSAPDRTLWKSPGPVGSLRSVSKILGSDWFVVSVVDDVMEVRYRTGDIPVERFEAASFNGSCEQVLLTSDANELVVASGGANLEFLSTSGKLYSRRTLEGVGPIELRASEFGFKTWGFRAGSGVYKFGPGGVELRGYTQGEPIVRSRVYAQSVGDLSSSGGKALLFGRGFFAVIDTKSGGVESRIPFDAEVECASFDPRSNVAVVAGKTSVWKLDFRAKTVEGLQIPIEPDDRVVAIEIVGANLVVIGTERDLILLKPSGVVRVTGLSASRIAGCPDGERFAIGTLGAVKILTGQGKEIGNLGFDSEAISALTWDGPSALVIAEGEHIHRWDGEEAREVFQCTPGGAVTALATSSRWKRIAVSIESELGMVLSIHNPDGEQVLAIERPEVVGCAELSFDEDSGDLTGFGTHGVLLRWSVGS